MAETPDGDKITIDFAIVQAGLHRKNCFGDKYRLSFNASHQVGLRFLLFFVSRTTVGGASSGVPLGLTIALALLVDELLIARLTGVRGSGAEPPDERLLVEVAPAVVPLFADRPPTSRHFPDVMLQTCGGQGYVGRVCRRPLIKSFETRFKDYPDSNKRTLSAGGKNPRPNTWCTRFILHVANLSHSSYVLTGVEVVASCAEDSQQYALLY